MGDNNTGANTQEQKRTKEDPGKKSKLEPAEKILSAPEDIEVQITECGPKNGASRVSQDMQLMLTVMQRRI